MVNNNNKTLKKFGLISSVIFAVIIAFSIVWIQLTDYSNFVFIQVINIMILASGLIGLGYCIIILRTFDTKIDSGLENIVKDLEEKDNNNSMSWENSSKQKENKSYVV